MKMTKKISISDDEFKELEKLFIDGKVFEVCFEVLAKKLTV